MLPQTCSWLFEHDHIPELYIDQDLPVNIYCSSQSLAGMDKHSFMLFEGKPA